MLKEKFLNYLQLMRADKPIGIFLLLWPTLIALFLAGDGKPNLSIVFIFILGVFLMRSAGCIINDIIDSQFDGHVERTANRPLVTKTVSSKEAIGLFFFLISLSFLLVIQLNFLTILLSFVALLLALVYPLMKRFIHAPQLILGMAFASSIPMAYAAILNTIPLASIYLFLATVLWVIVYDTQYAMVDREDDIKIGIKSTAIFFGDHDRLIIFVLQILVLVLFIGLGVHYQLGSLYYLGCGGAGILSLYQQNLIKNRTKKGCFQAFLNNNTFGALIFLGLFLEYMKSLYYL